MRQSNQRSLTLAHALCLALTGPLALLGTACGGSRQGSFDLELAGQIGGIVRHMQLDGDRAIVTLGPAAAVMDLGNPRRPTVSDERVMLEGRVVDIAGDAAHHAFVLTETGWLYVLDRTGPTGLKVLTRLRLEAGDQARWKGPPKVAMATDGRILVIAAEPYDGRLGARLYVLDVARPEVPAVVGMLDDSTDGLAVHDGFAYLSGADSSGGGLRIVDLRDPARPAILPAAAQPRSGKVLAQAGDRLYTVGDAPDSGNWGGSDDGLAIWSLANPVAPMLVALLRVPAAEEYLPTATPDPSGVLGLGLPPVDNPVAVALDGDHGYLATSMGGLFRFSAQAPEALDPIGGVPDDSAAFAGDLIAVDGVLFRLDDRDMYPPLDAGDPGAPRALGRVGGELYAWSAVVAGSRLVTPRDSHLAVFDVLDPLRPREALTVPVRTSRVESDGQRVMAWGSDQHLYTFDPLQAAAPTGLLTFAPPLGERQDFSASTSLVDGAALMARGDGLYMVDASLPDAMPTLGEVRGLGRPMALAALPGAAFVADAQPGRGQSSTRVIDTRDPGAMREVARVASFPSGIDLFGAAIAADSDRLVIANDLYRVEVFDVSDPAQPHRLAARDSVKVVNAAAADGLAVLASRLSLYGIDLRTDPPAFSTLSPIASWADVMDIDVRGPWAYLAAGRSGILVVAARGLER